MPEDRPPARGRREEQIWAALGLLAPAIVAVGCLGVVVGVVAGQSIGLIAIDAMVVIVGGILLLLLRWR
jgi:hypothetical protein